MAKSDACAVYNILCIRVDERKEILGLWIQDSENKHSWMQIFDELKFLHNLLDTAEAMKKAFSFVTPTDCHGWFSHCGLILTIL